MSAFIKATANLKKFMVEKHNIDPAGYFVLAEIDEIKLIREIANDSFVGKYLILAEMIILEKEEEAVPVMLSGVNFLE